MTFIKLLFCYIKNRLTTIILYGIFILVFIVVFYLNSSELDAVLYAFLLCSCIAVIFSVYDFFLYYKKHMGLCRLKKQIATSLKGMPFSSNLIEADYQSILKILYDDKLKISSKADKRQMEMEDYFSLWVHQIKTPIAAMQLVLQSEENEQNKELLGELFKIEQYAAMVLGYLRIENAPSDLVLQKHSLSEIVKQAVRKYASVFIRKNIILDFKEMEVVVLTDEKWLCFVIEQILSNALKYTNSGKISIYKDELNEKILVIEDTGIGIQEEDLPRIFEKGFTGCNGRMDKKATGIGLYLCKKILNKLSHKITIESKVGAGTAVKIDLSSVETVFE